MQYHGFLTFHNYVRRTFSKGAWTYEFYWMIPTLRCFTFARKTFWVYNLQLETRFWWGSLETMGAMKQGILTIMAWVGLSNSRSIAIIGLLISNSKDQFNSLMNEHCLSLYNENKFTIKTISQIPCSFIVRWVVVSLFESIEWFSIKNLF